jgi:hypothetical protein
MPPSFVQRIGFHTHRGPRHLSGTTFISDFEIKEPTGLGRSVVRCAPADGAPLRRGFRALHFGHHLNV